MKNLFIFIMLILLPLSLRADQVEVPIDNENTLGDSAEYLSDTVGMIVMVYDIVVECKMLESCINDKVIATGKTTKNPMFKEYAEKKAKYREKYQKEILFLEKICKSDSLEAAQSALMICMKASSENIKGGDKSLTQIFYEQDECVLDGLRPLAEKGNLYAMLALTDGTAEYATKDEKAKWTTELKKHEGDDEWRIVPMCSQQLRLY